MKKKIGMMTALVLTCSAMSVPAVLAEDVSSETILGDFNNDGVVNREDAFLMFAYFEKQGISAFDEQEPGDDTFLKRADLNRDGVVDCTDSIYMVALTRDDTETMLGDLDGDGKVNIDDAIKELSYYAYHSVGLDYAFSEDAAENERLFYLADVNFDGNLDITDALYIMKYYACMAAGGACLEIA